jgi:hypothetical protein
MEKDEQAWKEQSQKGYLFVRLGHIRENTDGVGDNVRAIDSQHWQVPERKAGLERPERLLGDALILECGSDGMEKQADALGTTRNGEVCEFQRSGSLWNRRRGIGEGQGERAKKRGEGKGKGKGKMGKGANGTQGKDKSERKREAKTRSKKEK